MSMCKVICVTNRKLAQDFPKQMEKIVRAGVDGVILREKDLSEAEYEELAAQIDEICWRANVPLTLHTYEEAALHLGIGRLHVPLHQLLAMDESQKRRFEVLSASVHAPEEAVKAREAGASWVAAGHVFATDCKPGLAPRGIPFLRETCEAAKIPVCAIGGVTPANAALCAEAGAAGVCLMSSLMRAEDPGELLKKIRG